MGSISATGNVPRVARDVERAIARDPREAMTSRIATAPGPIPQRLRTSGASTLDPTKITRIFDAADLGIAIYEYADLCKKMRETDTHLMGVDRHRRQAVANKPFLVSPSDDADPVAVALALLDRTVVREIENFSAAMYSAGSDNCDGWSLSELIWAQSVRRFRLPDGYGGGSVVEVEGLWPVGIEWIHPKHTEFDTAGANSDEPMLNVGSSGAIHLTPGKFLYTLAPGEGIASARGYSRAVVWMHFFKHASWRDWVVFLHLYGIPFLQGKIDRAKWKDDSMLDVLERALEVYGTGEERPILPDGLGIEVHDPVSIGGSGEAHKAMIGMCNAEISKAVEGVTLTTEAGGPGSYALGYVHADAAHEVIVGDAVAKSAAVTSQILRRANEINAPAIARAFALAGLNCRPWDLASRTPIGMFRTDREWTPEVRQRLLSGAIKDGVPVSMAQYRHELQLDAPHDANDHVKGEAVPVNKGASLKTPADVAQGNADNPDEAADLKARAEVAKAQAESNPPAPTSDGDKEDKNT
jgi:phage gp29-like protein